MSESPRPPWGDEPEQRRPGEAPPAGENPPAGANPPAGESPPAGETPPTGENPPAGDYPPPGAGYQRPGEYPPGEYQPPGGYPPPGGYQQPGEYPPPWSPGDRPTGEDRTWVLVTHFGGAAAGFITGGVLGWIPPLIAMLSRGPHSPLVRAHAVDALNFQVLWAVIAAVGYVLGTCGLFFVVGAVLYILTLVAIIMETVFGIIAGIKATNGEPYRYPGSPNWIR